MAIYKTGPSRHEIAPSLNLDFANTKKLDPRITFTRTTTATYYDGVTHEKAEENLVKYSQEFDNAAWSKQLVTVTGDTETAPNGTTTADTVTEDNSANIHRLNQTTSASGVVTLSVFAKAGTGSRFLTIGVNNSAANYASATFDLSAGTNTQTLVNGTYSSQSAAITSVANGFYRCSLTVTTDTVGAATIGLSPTSTFSSGSRGFDSYTGDGTSSIHLWGAQLEQRSSVTAYTPTTDQPITNYIPALQTAASGEARFDHNPTTGESLGLLIEEQRTNLVTYSAEFDNAGWSKFDTSITADTIVAPDGTLTGDLIVSNTDNDFHYLTQSFSKTAQTYTGSVFIKKQNYRYVDLGFQGVTNWNGTPQVKFDLDDGAVQTLGASAIGTITPVGNGWFRCTLTSTSLNTTGSSFSINFNAESGSTFPTYSGNGFDGGYIWGAQLEEGSFPTSYIATSGSQVTRGPDVAQMTGDNFSSWYRQDEGTVYSEAQIARQCDVAGTGVFQMDDGSSNQRIHVFYRANAQTGSTIAKNGTNETDVFPTGTLTANEPFRNALAYKFNDVADSGNGEAVKTDLEASIPNLNRLLIGVRLARLNGTIKKFAFYPARLPNDTLVALTED